MSVENQIAIRRCTVCGKEFSFHPPALPPGFPFCSPRCRGMDLHRWFSGAYVVPGRNNAFQEQTELEEMADQAEFTFETPDPISLTPFDAEAT
jgi:endogenous inhibitor of DNA gyrase (YacG/DUF329 family)